MATCIIERGAGGGGDGAGAVSDSGLDKRPTIFPESLTLAYPDRGTQTFTPSGS